MALILCKDSNNRVGWRDETNTINIRKLRKESTNVGWKFDQKHGFYLFKDGPDVGWRLKIFFDNIDFNGEPIYIEIPPGRFRFQCWGASGGWGQGRVNPRGLGGYCSGDITFYDEIGIWIYPGQEGAHFDSGALGRSGFNGGGFFLPAGLPAHQGGNGGGATDIRTTGGNWDDITSLRSRIMVAGGGGGGGSTCGGSVPLHTPGHGGPLTGQDSWNNTPYGTECYNAHGTGGTQTSGGVGYGYTGGNMTPQWGLNGSLGKGANSETCGAGAGGGYYGGGSAYGVGSGGGSSFISGHPGCNAVNSSGVHTGQPNHFSGLVFTNTVMTRGVRDGGGNIMITFLGNAA